jgi:probable phosphoglycerate mutase
MKWPRELFIIRHGESARNRMRAAAKAAGAAADYSLGVRDQDTPLTAVGLTQAEMTGRYLGGLFPTAPGIPRGPIIDTMYISPYLRTQQTAERILFGMHQTVPVRQIYDERIREIEFGLFDGLSPEALRQKYSSELVRRAREGKYWYRPPGGESRPDVRLRCRSFIDTLIRDCADKRVVVVTHSVVVLALRSLLERWGEEQYLTVDKENDVLNCGITYYKFDLEFLKLKLQTYNQIAY